MIRDVPRGDPVAIDWHSLRSAVGMSGFVPAALTRLLRAHTEAEAQDAYWELDNRIVLQGQLYESATYVIAPLCAGLGASTSRAARAYVLDLLVEIALGEPSQSEIAHANGALHAECRDALRQATPLFRSFLTDSDPHVRLAAFEILNAVDLDRDHINAIRADLANDSDAHVRRRASESD